MDNNSPERPDLNDDARRIWDTNAEWWDDRIGNGNDFQRELLEPTTEKLLQIRPGTAVLDIACGAGRFARRMAELGASVLGVDFSEKFIGRARQRTPRELKGVEYRVLDASDREALLALGRGRFDGAVCTMGLMDMAQVEPLFSALPALLKPGGWFAFSILHPCFQPPAFRRFAESSDEGTQLGVRNGVQISRYLTPTAYKGIGVVGQPESQWYFHRPLSLILKLGFAHGLAVDGLEEPAFAPRPSDGRHLRWDQMPEIPPVLVVRMRLVRA